MNIYTVRDNLLKTIAGKEKLLSQLEPRRNIPRAAGDQMAMVATIEFLKINLDELYGILNDVQACCKQATNASWETNPDRSGGQFTQDEIDNANRW